MAKKGFGFKPKENGGMIRGPGTGTSDSIATEMQPGTYIMPADSTRTIGDKRSRTWLMPRFLCA